MAENRSARSVSVRPFRPQGLLQEGRLPVGRPDGSEGRQVAAAFDQLANELGGMADSLAVAEGERAGTLAGGEEGFRPTRRLTLRGRAFDKAGISSYMDRLDANLRQDMQLLYESRKDDPAGLITGIEELQKIYHSKHVFDEIKPAFDSAFIRLGNAYRNRATENFDVRQRELRQGELITTLSDLQTAQSQQLASLDPTDPEAPVVLHDTQSQIDAQYDRAVEEELMTPAAAAAAKIEDRRTAGVQFYLRQAQNLSNPADIVEFGDRIREAHAAGELAGVDADGYQDLIAGVATLETRAKTEGRASSNALGKRLDSYVDRIADGLEAPPAEWAQLRLDAASAPDGDNLVEEARAKLVYARIIRDRPLGEAEQAVAALRGELQKDATAGGAAVLDFAEKTLAAEKTRLRTGASIDAALHRGIIKEATPLVLDGDMNSLAAQITARVAQTDAAAAALGVPPRYLRPAEAQLIEERAARDPEAAVNIAGGLVAGAGARAADVLKELGGNDVAEAKPMRAAIAQAGSLLAGGGSSEAARDVLRGAFSDQQTGTRPPDVPQATRFSGNDALGNSLVLQPDDSLRVKETARNIARARVAAAGVAPDSSEASTIYEQALVDATGAIRHDGAQFGGLAAYDRGWLSWEVKTIVPPGVRADSFRDVVLAIQDGDLGALDVPPQNEDGSAIGARALHQAIPVLVNGGYAFALGDPAGEDPRFVRGADGQPFVLDFEKLRPMLQRRVPGAFLGQ